MSGSFSLSIPNLGVMHVGSTRRSEASEIKNAVDVVMQKMVSSAGTSFNIIDRLGANVGSLSWTPVNST